MVVWLMPSLKTYIKIQIPEGATGHTLVEQPLILSTWHTGPGEWLIVGHFLHFSGPALPVFSVDIED